MKNNTCRKCRREGVKLFLKGEKCSSPKCPFTRRAYQPGDKGSRPRMPKMSDYAFQLREKQKARRSYDLLEKQFKNYFNRASQYAGSTAEKLVQLLESRIDNAVYRAGLAPSRRAARQMVSHARVKLNGRKVSIPSIQLKKNDQVEVKLNKNAKLTGFNPPAWIKVDKKKSSFEIISQPGAKPEELGLDVQLIVEYYSR